MENNFSTDIPYNITCMATEKPMVTYLMKNSALAENHAMGDLLKALQLHLGEIADLAKDLICLDTFQEICDLNSLTIRMPADNDIIRILAIAEKVRTAPRPLDELLN